MRNGNKHPFLFVFKKGYIMKPLDAYDVYKKNNQNRDWYQPRRRPKIKFDVTAYFAKPLKHHPRKTQTVDTWSDEDEERLNQLIESYTEKGGTR